MREMIAPGSIPLYRIVVAAGALVLAWQPLRWLLATWFDPLYDSIGLAVALLVVAVALWSSSSPRGDRDPRAERWAWWLVFAAALVRLAGQSLGVNSIAALALVVDVYALSVLAGLSVRTRAVSPFWLAMLFALSLPLERIVQRTLGFGLQQVSAAGACQALDALGTEARCQGLRIVWHQRDALVDLPCSGTAGLIVQLCVFALVACLVRPRPLWALVGLIGALGLSIVANSARIVVLASAIAHPDLISIDVLAAPWHEMIGLSAMGLAAAPVLLWARYARQTIPIDTAARENRDESSGVPARGQRQEQAQALFVTLFLAVVAAALLVPTRPIDVAEPIQGLALPLSIAGVAARADPLSEREQRYFTEFGGAAARAHYGPFGLLVVSTSAPLRHLHAPDECWSGAGFDVRYIGPSFDAVPAALYRAHDATTGRSYRIAVTYVSDRGRVATSVAEAVWYWLGSPETTWTMVQRIAPTELGSRAHAHWDRAVAVALDLPRSSAFPSPTL